MSKAKLDLKDKNDDELAAYCTNHKLKMTGNATFPTPMPAAAIFDATLSDFVKKLAAYREALHTAEQLRAAKDDSREVLEYAMTQRGGYVEVTAANEEQMLSAGVEARASNGPTGELPAPQNLMATLGDHEGEIDVAWNRVRGAGSYIIDCRLSDEAGAEWQQAKISQKSRVTVPGLVSGKKYSFRVRAVGPAGEGAWSNEAILMAP